MLRQLPHLSVCCRKDEIACVNMQSARNNYLPLHNGTTFRANEHANTKLATKYFHVQSDANPNQANRHWICFSFRLRFVFANTIQSEMEKSQKTASLLNFPSRFFKFCPPVSTIFRRVYLCSPRGLPFTSPLLLCENTISPKCQYFMNQ